jgi:transposase
LVREIVTIADHLTIVASPFQPSAVCPTCAVASLRVHSHYERRLHDLPSQGRPVTLCIQVRRFRCLNPQCPRQTFVERLNDIAAVAARRTMRLGQLQCDLALALGGEAGARLADRLALSTSPDTLLRMATRAADMISAPPACAGG